MMIFVKGSTFEMGSPTGMADERPLHTVTLDDFYMEDHLVTQSEWKKIMGVNPAYFSANPQKGESQVKRPVEHVSHYDALVYCNRRSIAEKLTPCYVIAGKDNPDEWGDVPDEQNAKWDTVTCRWDVNGYRLPTESEWEYAARGGIHNGQKKAAKDADESRSWNKSNSDNMSHAVCLKSASVLGFYDLFGNVWEWCWDWYDCYQLGEFVNPRGAERTSENTDRAGRGGAWNAEASDCSPCFRNCGSPAARYNFIGIRVVRTKK
ncbi:MAG: formylglycine-generating enzyme family protein [Treponema sp.]|nr:formylglycine-generating enzyme family protein [Treponema sp.]